jgi:competence protein ComEC
MMKKMMQKARAKILDIIYKRPLLLCCACFILGVIAFSSAFGVQVTILICALIALLTLFIFKPISIAFIIAFLIGCGSVLFSLSNYYEFDSEKHSIVGVVTNFNSNNNSATIKTLQIDHVNNAKNLRMTIYPAEGESVDAEAGADMPELMYGDVVSFVGKISPPRSSNIYGGFDEFHYYMARGFDARTYTTPIGLEVLEHNYNPYLINANSFDSFMARTPVPIIQNYVSKAAFTCRQYIRMACDANFIGDDSKLLQGILLGDTKGFSDDFYADVKDAGASHIVAMSGEHVSVIVVIITFLIQWFFYRRLSANIASLFTIIIFFLIMDYTPSFARAIIMSTLMLVSFVLNKRYDVLTSFAVSACVIMLFSPFAIFDISFIISFLSVMTIIIFATPITQIWSGFRHKVLATIIIGICAQLGTTLPIAYYFNSFNLNSIISTFFLTPLVAIVLVFGYANMVLCAFIWHVGSISCYATSIFIVIIRKIIELSGDYLPFNYKVSPPGVSFIIIYIAAMIVIYYLINDFVRYLKSKRGQSFYW